MEAAGGVQFWAVRTGKLAMISPCIAVVETVHARGESIPRIIVQPGETVEEVREREGIADGMPYVARIIVGP